MANYKYDHAHHISPDPEQAAAFYVNMFNAKIASKGVAPDGTIAVAVDLAGANIFFKGRAERPTVQAPPAGTTYGLEHLGIVTDDLDTAVAELKAKGAKFVQDITNYRPGIRISFLEGPDNTIIELLERKPVS